MDTLKRLETHLERISRRISDSIIEASEKHSGTPESVANAREIAFRAVIERFFPFPYKITKGSIYDSFGGRSASIDCVICAPNHPSLNDESGNIEIILVDGVYTAIELKPDLTDLPKDFGEHRKQKPEIIRALEQVKTVKELRRVERSLFGSHTNEKIDYSLRCPTYIASNNSTAIDVLAKYISDYYLQNNVPAQKQFDVFLVINKGLIINNKASDFSLTQPTNLQEWLPHMAVYGTDKAFRLFMYRLVSEIGPEMSMSKPVLQRYLEKMKRPKPICTFNNTV